MFLFILIALIVWAFCIGVGWFMSDGSTGSLPLMMGFAIAATLTIFFFWLSFGTEQRIAITVDGKERIAEDNDGKWVVYAKSGETFENTDAWFHGKSDSTNLQRKLVVGKTYRCLVNGKRFTVLSWYRNILECEPVR